MLLEDILIRKYILACRANKFSFAWAPPCRFRAKYVVYSLLVSATPTCYFDNCIKPVLHVMKSHVLNDLKPILNNAIIGIH